MTDQYKEQYKKETEQIHAPADLIARTKAAVREEEARVLRERTAQTEGFTGQAAESAMQQAPAMEKTRSWGAAARKWAYPLTAAAAIVVLVSVSMMMRGLGKSGSDSEASYESAAAADCGGEESAAAEEAFDEVFPEAEAAAEEAPEDALLSEGAAAGGADMGIAFAEAVQDVESEAQTDSEERTSGSGATPVAEEADSADETKRAAADELSGESKGMENTTAQKREEEMSADLTAVDVTVKRVWKRPAFADSADAELQSYEDKTFWVVREDEGWAAYVESENRGGYEIRGEAESVEAFLEAACRRLEEMSF